MVDELHEELMIRFAPRETKVSKIDGSEVEVMVRTSQMDVDQKRQYINAIIAYFPSIPPADS